MSEEKTKHGERPGDPCTIVIFGAGGDLTRRKLLPALYNLRHNGILPVDFAIVGVGRKNLKREDFVAEMTDEISEYATLQERTIVPAAGEAIAAWLSK